MLRRWWAMAPDWDTPEATVDADALPTHEHGWNGVMDKLEARVLAAPRSGAA